MSKHIQKRMVFASVFRSRKYLKLRELAGDAIPFCHSLFIMILTHAADHGRYSGEPAVVKMECSSCLLPIASFEAGIAALEKAALVTRYEVAGEKFVHVVNFHEWQFLRYQAEAKYPAPQQNGTTPKLKKSGGKKKKPAEPDDRILPLREFLVQEYCRIRGVEVFTDDSDWVNLARMLKTTKNPKIVLGMPSGWTDLDMITRGFEDGALVTITARPGMGKTTLMMNMANHAG